ncbi:hypothetical protein [Agrobacterium rosae]|uniref:Antitoxin SocA-like Panacea domain-containing protein n=1 Tax=Agrobacterium rosae TaxID=1972867 RepID=A0A1R3U6X6_9HYPH|nr:hypothetical protein [Agrobacterium rosae]SCX35015.1 hypothetical protein DSM25559_4737 [Agrobacterium rosae]
MDMSLIYAVFEAADNKIVGRIRVQKIFYLLEKLGLNGGARFSYYHYGPYSETLANELDFAQLLDNRLDEKIAETQFGASYSIFELAPSKDGTQVDFVGEIPIESAKQYVKAMKSRTSVAIELAATIHWLKHEEKVDDWKKELKKRKPAKASQENMSEALRLLDELGLDTKH